MTKRVTVQDAKRQLSTLLDRVSKGESFVITKRGRAVALLSSVQKPKRPKIRFGLMKGKIKFAPDFDDPLPEEILEAFEGGASKDPV
jgi:prevent-host-death family protein